jgi:oligoendopeptidase F
VRRNALKDQRGAVAAYRRALALGGTASIPALYAAAGARFAMDEEVLSEVLELVNDEIAILEKV